MVGMFSDANLKSLVDTTLVDLPANHTNAVVATVDDKGVAVVVGFKKETNSVTWQVTGAFQHSFDGDNAAGAKVVASW